MSNVTSRMDEGTLVLEFHGHIDSGNAAQAEADVNAAREANPHSHLLIDAEDLQYISSVGLRLVLKLKKQEKDLEIINVTPEVYEVFDMTGFTEMMEIKKAYRRLSVEGCEVIGQGSNGMVYRLDPDTIIKVYRNPDSLPDIHREQELARKAFVLGIPTALSYDVVRVGEGYGSVFELLNAKSFAKIVKNQPERTDEIVGKFVDLAKKLHSTEVNPADMPDMRAVAVKWVKFLEGHIPADQFAKLTALVDAVPERRTMLHGDYHFKNVMEQDGEILLIDMDTLCYGHPVFELASTYLAYVGFGETNPASIEKFMGLPSDVTGKIWLKTLELYFDTKDPAALQAYSDKARVVGYTRLLRRTLRREPDNTIVIDNCKKQLGVLLARVDSLDF